MKFTDELERLLAGATPRPWRHQTYMSGTQNVEFPGARSVAFIDRIMAEDGSDISMQDDHRNLIYVLHRPADRNNESDPERTANAALIVHLANAAPALLELVRAADKIANPPTVASSNQAMLLHWEWIDKLRDALSRLETK